MKRDRHITTQIHHGMNTRTTTGRPATRKTNRPPINFGPDIDRRGPQGPGAEARALMEHNRDKAQEAIRNAIANGAAPKDALRMARNFLLAGRRANTQYQAEIHGGEVQPSI